MLSRRCRVSTNSRPKPGVFRNCSTGTRVQYNAIYNQGGDAIIHNPTTLLPPGSPADFSRVRNAGTMVLRTVLYICTWRDIVSFACRSGRLPTFPEKPDTTVTKYVSYPTPPLVVSMHDSVRIRSPTPYTQPKFRRWGQGDQSTFPLTRMRSPLALPCRQITLFIYYLSNQKGWGGGGLGM